MENPVHSPNDPLLAASDRFPERHIGPRPEDVEGMLGELGIDSLEALVEEVIPAPVRRKNTLALRGLPDPAWSESEAALKLRALASRNQVLRSCIGMGYSECIVPPVIQRNVLENPGWYTAYTPYQAEISQGRLEALLNFQTMIADLTALPLANASLLDEATSAAEAMAMCHAIARKRRPTFLVADDCHPQTIGVVGTRARSMGIRLRVGAPDGFDFEAEEACGLLLQYPDTDGRLRDPRALIERAQGAGTRVVMAADLLALTLVAAPGELGADIAVGSTQRFGVPMGFGGPHAGYISTREEHARKLPGRLVGVSLDNHGNPALRLAIQTREQHIRRDRATSNICTAQVLLAIMAGMYAVYHGPEGLRRIAKRVRGWTACLAQGLRDQGHALPDTPFFDTLRVTPIGLDGSDIIAEARRRGFNLRAYEDGSVGVALGETTGQGDIEQILASFAPMGSTPSVEEVRKAADLPLPPELTRRTPYLEHPVFHRHHAEHEMLRYLHRLESRDLSLTTSMIPLGSCTMKLNASHEMVPVSWPEFANLHPYAPVDQTKGYQELFGDLEDWLAAITELPAVSLQPNAGSQGEYAGLLAIRRYHEARGEGERDACLIPASAHGTNAASAVIAGMRVVAVACDENGNVDLGDLQARCQEEGERVGALMITYPSTHGVFEAGVLRACEIVHTAGGQVYMDGANLNAQVGLSSPGHIGADVCHLNLHKTFAIPHGGGGPGMGPIAAATHLADFLPGDPLGGESPVSAAAHGSPGILPISWAYIACMGATGLSHASRIAILNANYMATRLRDHYDILFTGEGGWVAHEFIIDCRSFERSTGVGVEDIAKRLMDYGFHAPTMSFPVPGTLMIEPTESESREEIDRLCDALIAIRREVDCVEHGKWDAEDNPLRNAPHTARAVCGDSWPHAYSREEAAYPAPWLRDHKYWTPVGRIDNAYGDRHLVCTRQSGEKAAKSAGEA